MNTDRERNRGRGPIAVAAAVIVALVMGVLALPATVAGAATATVGNGLATTDLSAVGMSPASLASALVGSGVTVSNVTYTGDNAQAGLIHLVDPAVVSFNDGVILSSGNIADVMGPNKSDGITGDMAGPADADLNALIANTQTVYPMTFDAASLEFDFVPSASQVYFTYTFASDEYLEWVNLFNDVFAFYVNGQNCATVPNGDPVSIDTINSAVNPGLFRDNSYSSPPANPINIESDGLSVEMICSAPVNAGQTNHMKIAIADTSDQILDSVVMIKAQSLSTAKPESCNDGVDNDDDTLVDDADDSCTTTTTPPPIGSSGIGSSGSAPPFTGNEGTPIPLDASALGWTASSEAVSASWTVTGINGTPGTCEVDPVGPMPIGGDGSIPVATAVCPDEGEYVARVEGLDAEGKSSFDYDVDFFVHNAPPAVTIDTPASGAPFSVGDPVDVSATVVDPGAGDAVTCEVAWGDGSSEAGTLTDGTCTASHTYTSEGSVLLSVTGTDDAGDSSAAAMLVPVEARSISGTVTAGGSPVAGVTVIAAADTDVWYPTGITTTGADGSYTLAGLPDGTYRVAFLPLAQPTLGVEWYGDAPSRSAATPLDVTAGTALTGIDAALDEVSTIAGQVTGPDGQPVAGVLVGAYSDTDGWFPSTYTTTGADGRYRFAAVPPGAYRIAFVPTAASGLRATWEGGTTNRWAAPLHTITHGTVLAGIDAQLVATTSLSGTVTGPGGVPVAGARVSAYDADDRYAGTAAVTTGADGTYRLSSLPANTYRIMVAPPAGSGLTTRWYLASTTRSTATPVVVSNGATISGIDVALG